MTQLKMAYLGIEDLTGTCEQPQLYLVILNNKLMALQLKDIFIFIYHKRCTSIQLHSLEHWSYRQGPEEHERDTIQITGPIC